MSACRCWELVRMVPSVWMLLAVTESFKSTVAPARDLLLAGEAEISVAVQLACSWNRCLLVGIRRVHASIGRVSPRFCELPIGIGGLIDHHPYR